MMFVHIQSKKRYWFCAIVLGVMSLGVHPVAAQSTEENATDAAASAARPRQLERLNRISADFDNVVKTLAQKWTDPSGENESALARTFGTLSPSQLLAIQDAVNLDDVRLIATGQEPDDADLLTALEASPVEPLTLGSLDRDFVYTPVTPCRTVDTRIAGGFIGAGLARTFVVHGAVVGQGGNAAGCPSPRGEPRAVHMNVTVVPVSGNGFIKVYPFNTPEPNASLVNFKLGTNIANAATIKTAFLLGPDITVKASQRAHVVIDVLGYYHEAEEVVEHASLPSSTNIAQSPSWTNCGSIAINAPGPGKVIVTAKATGWTFGQDTVIEFGIGTNTTSIVEGVSVGVIDGTDTIRRQYALVDQVVFIRSAAGVVTYFVNAQKKQFSGARQAAVIDIRVTAEYVAD